MSLIEGLPDAITLLCLARVPFHHYPQLKTVSKSWHSAINSNELYKTRKQLNSTESFLCVCAFDPENTFQLYDPTQNKWSTLPTLPSTIRNLAHFGVVSTSNKLFVLGGGSDAVDPLTGDQDGSFATNEVWSYDPRIHEWAPRAPMITPRSMFACCVINDKILVAGGFTTCRKSISKCEIYDPKNDSWVAIQDLVYTHNTACTGFVINNEPHVVHKGLTKVNVLKSFKDGWVVVDRSWAHGALTVVNRELYSMSHGVVYKEEGDDKRKVVGSGSEFKKRIGFAMIGFLNDIYVIGGVIGPQGWNWDIKKMSDVDVLCLGNERPVWVKAGPMTSCRGTILGCAELTI